MAALPSSLSKVPHAPTLKTITPTPGQSWSNYWTVITGMAVFMFLLYVVSNGLAAKWLALFSYSTPNVVQPSSNAIGSAATALGATALNQVASGLAGNAPKSDSVTGPAGAAQVDAGAADLAGYGAISGYLGSALKKFGSGFSGAIGGIGVQ